MLPLVLRIQEDFAAAVQIVQTEKQKLLPNSNCQKPLGDRLLTNVRPRLGVKVGRQNWFKARSIKHCVDMAGPGNVSVENKIDGEYCQVHVDPLKGRAGIQIFSKSGKDSTEDRQALIG